MNQFSFFTGFIIVGVVVLALAISVLTGQKQYDYGKLIMGLVALGFLMCTFGRIGYVYKNIPVSFISIVGTIFGIIALLMGLLILFNKHIPFVKNNKQAFILVLIIIITKVALVQVHTLFIKRF